MMIDGVRPLVSEVELEAARRRQLDRAWDALGAEIVALEIDDLVGEGEG